MKKLILDPENQYVKNILNRDENIDRLIKLVGEIEININDNYFSSLIESIIGQQLSMKAAETIWNRTLNLVGDITPENILKFSDEEFRNIGISRNKIKYMKDLAQKVKDNIIDLENIYKLEDEKIIQNLIKVKGIGRWTAEMFLIFSLGRMDVFSIQDLGLKKSIMWLYNLSDLPSNEFLLNLSNKFKPYRTVLSLYLWGAINKAYVK